EMDIVNGDEGASLRASEPPATARVLATSRAAAAKEPARAAPWPSPPPTVVVGPQASARIGPLVAVAADAALSDPSSSPAETTRAYSPCVGCGVDGDGPTRIVYRPWPFLGTSKWTATVRSLLSWASSKATRLPLGSYR